MPNKPTTSGLETFGLERRGRATAIPLCCATNSLYNYMQRFPLRSIAKGQENGQLALYALPKSADRYPIIQNR